MPRMPSTLVQAVLARTAAGLVLGEGAAMLVLEPLGARASRAAPRSSARSSATASSPTRRTSRGRASRDRRAAMRAALRSAALDAGAVDRYINAHGTGTRGERRGRDARRSRRVFGARATRDSGQRDQVDARPPARRRRRARARAALPRMQHAVALPTMHLRVPDPACDLDYVPNARATRWRRARCCRARSRSAARTRCWRCARPVDGCIPPREAAAPRRAASHQAATSPGRARIAPPDGL